MTLISSPGSGAEQSHTRNARVGSAIGTNRPVSRQPKTSATTSPNASPSFAIDSRWLGLIEESMRVWIAHGAAFSPSERKSNPTESDRRAARAMVIARSS